MYINNDTTIVVSYLVYLLISFTLTVFVAELPAASVAVTVSLTRTLPRVRLLPSACLIALSAFLPSLKVSFESAPERHLTAASLMAPDRDKVNDPKEQLPTVLTELMRDIGIPNGIGAVGYTESDIPDLVPGTMKQQRLLATCPRPVTEDDIAAIFGKSIENW